MWNIIWRKTPKQLLFVDKKDTGTTKNKKIQDFSNKVNIKILINFFFNPITI